MTLVVLVTLAGSVAGCLTPLLYNPAQAGLRFHDQPPQVRVLLPTDSSVFTVRSEARTAIRTTKPGSDPATFSARGAVRIARIRDGISIFAEGGVKLDSGLTGLWIQASGQVGKLWLNGRPYFGVLIFGFGSNGSLTVINRLNLDTYLEGVLTPELGERTEGEFEAVKAQAVASRTYALAHLGQYPNAPYDLRADVGDQIYVGASQQRDWVDRAVDATRGEVITYDGHMIDAYYHSTCGGGTDAIEKIWFKTPRPYLVAVDDDTTCKWSKYWNWTETFDSATLLNNLRAHRRRQDAPPIGDFTIINDILLSDSTHGGRNARMVLVTPQGRWTIASDEIRWALGRPSRNEGILPSSRFSLDLQRAADGSVIGAVARGRGYGHGVGLCQCGMIGRARSGAVYRDILTHYYPGVRIDRAY
jgi:stage II sporulation protein D